MRLDIIAALPLLATGAVAATPFSNNVIYTPGDDFTDPGVLYARTALLDSGVLLATWENYTPEPPMVSFPVYRSEDDGQTWEEIAQIEDQVNGVGLRYQPQLFVLPSAVGNYSAGTILCAGNSIPTDLSTTQIDLYASTDDGYTWEFLSHVASGGEALPNNGLTPVWEPHMIVYEDQLVLYYADQRDTDHGQKMSHQVTSDLLTWSDPVDDVSYEDYEARPGMPSVTLLPNGEYLFAYEYGGGPVGDGSDTSYRFPVYYRLSSDPLDFNSAEGLALIADDGTVPTSSPYVTWTPIGDDENGTIVVSSNSHTDIFVNQALGAVDAWRRIPTEEATSYSRSLCVLSDQNYLLIIGGGVLPPSDSNNVRLGVMDLEAALLA